MPRSAHSALKSRIQAAEATLRQLERQVRALGPALANATKDLAAAVAEAEARASGILGPKRQLSPQRRRALKVQGRYLGYMRQLNRAQKARVKAVKARRGYRAAIILARKLGK